MEEKVMTNIKNDITALIKSGNIVRVDQSCNKYSINSDQLKYIIDNISGYDIKYSDIVKGYIASPSTNNTSSKESINFDTLKNEVFDILINYEDKGMEKEKRLSLSSDLYGNDENPGPLMTLIREGFINIDEAECKRPLPCSALRDICKKLNIPVTIRDKDYRDITKSTVNYHPYFFALKSAAHKIAVENKDNFEEFDSFGDKDKDDSEAIKECILSYIQNCTFSAYRRVREYILATYKESDTIKPFLSKKGVLLSGGFIELCDSLGISIDSYLIDGVLTYNAVAKEEKETLPESEIKESETKEVEMNNIETDTNDNAVYDVIDQDKLLEVQELLLKDVYKVRYHDPTFGSMRNSLYDKYKYVVNNNTKVSKVKGLMGYKDIDNLLEKLDLKMVKDNGKFTIYPINENDKKFTDILKARELHHKIIQKQLPQVPNPTESTYNNPVTHVFIPADFTDKKPETVEATQQETAKNTVNGFNIDSTELNFKLTEEGVKMWNEYIEYLINTVSKCIPRQYFKKMMDDILPKFDKETSNLRMSFMELSDIYSIMYGIKNVKKEDVSTFIFGNMFEHNITF